MRIQSCVELGSAAFHLFLWGRRTVFVWKKTWHTRNIPSLPQEINLFERAAGLKIGKPQNNSVGINCPDFCEKARRLKRAKVCSPSCFQMCVMEILVWSSCHVILFWYISACLELSNRTESQSFSSPTYHLSTHLPAALFDRIWWFITSSPQ